MNETPKQRRGKTAWFSVKRAMETEKRKGLDEEIEALLDDADEDSALKIFAEIARTGSPDEKENAMLGMLVMMERLKRHEEWTSALTVAQTILTIEPKNRMALDTIADLRNIMASCLMETDEQEAQKQRREFN